MAEHDAGGDADLLALDRLERVDAAGRAARVGERTGDKRYLLADIQGRLFVVRRHDRGRRYQVGVRVTLHGAQDRGETHAVVRNPAHTDGAARADQPRRIHYAATRCAAELHDATQEVGEVREGDRRILALCIAGGDGHAQFVLAVDDDFHDDGFDEYLRPADVELVDEIANAIAEHAKGAG